jgi:hypothetical protein
MKRTASCSCGQLKVTTQGEPVRISVCHCLACQRRTGSAFGAQARFKEADVVIEGIAHHYARTGDSGGKLDFRFCARCGSTVFWTNARTPELVSVAVGAFADPAFAAPRFSVYEAHRHPWAIIRGDVERQD